MTTPTPKTKLESLVTDYPELFQNLDETRKRDLVDGELFFHFSCDDGWYDILKSTCHLIKQRLGRYRDVVAIRNRLIASGKPIGNYEWIIKYFEKHLKDPLDTFSIDQIKEKFGGLRFYYSGIEGADLDYVHGVVDMAESMSYRTCELCGNAGKGVGRGWIQTLCAHHQKTYNH